MDNLASAVSHLAEIFDCEIDVEKADGNSEDKAKIASPGKAAIVVK